MRNIVYLLFFVLLSSILQPESQGQQDTHIDVLTIDMLLSFMRMGEAEN